MIVACIAGTKLLFVHLRAPHIERLMPMSRQHLENALGVGFYICQQLISQKFSLNLKEHYLHVNFLTCAPRLKVGHGVKQ